MLNLSSRLCGRNDFIRLPAQTLNFQFYFISRTKYNRRIAERADPGRLWEFGRMVSSLIGRYPNNPSIFPNSKRTTGFLMTLYDTAHRLF
ncbi:MAG: hypothetical protein Q7J98_03280 [Kiritimatiellia bacterium]|nr:hypothetical protein [Kiritimatiellia bacterium]